MKKPTYEDLKRRIRQLEHELEQQHKNLSDLITNKIPWNESDEKYLMIFNHLTEAIALHKMIRDENGNIIDFTYEGMNPAREKMVDRTFSEIKNLTVRQVNPDIVDNIMEVYGGVAITGIPLTFEFHTEVFKKDLRVKVFSPQYGYVGTIIEDVTEQKNSEKKLRTSEKKLRELNLTKDKLFSIIAHDLRSPFNSILGYSQLLRENIRKYKIEEIEKYLDIINSSAQNTFNLLINLLSWAKNQTGQTSFYPETLILRNIIEEVADLLSSSAKNKNITLNHSLSEDIKIYADKNMLKTILQNLIFNALKFTHPGGIINVHARAHGGYAEITVSDNGIGISRNNIKALFDLETQIPTTGTSNETGSGLGLVISREFVEKHGGRIWVESEEKKGSDFKFTLPMENS